MQDQLMTAKSNDLPGLQSTQSWGGSQVFQDIIEQCLSVMISQTDMSAAQKRCIKSHFAELADNYITARIPVLADPDQNEGAGKSLNELMK